MDVEVTLKQPHEHHGVLLPAGTTITVDAHTAEWMEKHAPHVVGKAVRSKERKPAFKITELTDEE